MGAGASSARPGARGRCAVARIHSGDSTGTGRSANGAPRAGGGETLGADVRHSSLHRDWMLHGLDAALAARALGRLEAAESAPAIVEAIRRVHPALSRGSSPATAAYPISWSGWRKSYLVEALGDLRCDASKEFLFEYVRAAESTVSQWSYPQYEEATRSLLRQRLTRTELEELLRSSNLAVRGTAVLECVDNPDEEREAARQKSAPWARELPRAK